MIIKPDFNDIIASYGRIKRYIHHTPVFTSQKLNDLFSAKLYFKCENFQKVGAFKTRGALNAILQLSPEQLINGVATHSSGNFAQALAYSANILGTNATVIMPNSAPKVKVDAVRSYGAEIIFCEPTLQARKKTLEQFINSSGAEFIHPYNDYNVIAGQGTTALEFLIDYPDLDIIIAPIGGGGLISGTAIATKGSNPKIKIIAAEPKGADDAFRSKKAGYIIPSVNPKTIADGLLTSLGDKTFPIVNTLVDDIFTVQDESIITAMKLIFSRMKLLVEPSAAVPLAAILEYQNIFIEKKVGIILSGGNIDLDKLSKFFS